MSKVYTGNGNTNIRVNGESLVSIRSLRTQPSLKLVEWLGYAVLYDYLQGDENLALELAPDFTHDMLLPRLGGEWVLTQDEIEQYLGKISGPMIAHPTETPPANPTPWHWDVHEVDQDGVYSPLFAWNGFTAAYAQNETDDWRAAIQADKDAAAQFEAQII